MPNTRQTQSSTPIYIPGSICTIRVRFELENVSIGNLIMSPNAAEERVDGLMRSFRIIDQSEETKEPVRHAGEIHMSNRYPRRSKLIGIHDSFIVQNVAFGGNDQRRWKVGMRGGIARTYTPVVAPVRVRKIAFQEPCHRIGL